MKRPEDVRKSVSSSYAHAVSRSAPAGASCCSGPAPEGALTTLAGYSREELAALPADAVASSFGCGNPVALAEIREGDTVLDLGSGAGIDLLLAARLAGPEGRVIGVDMTSAMVEHARENVAAAGLANVEVLEGIIEELPVESGSVDLVVSNCVINLSPEKERVFAELHRVLRPGGRISISDIVAEPMPSWIAEASALHSACISGAIPEADYLRGLREAGLADVAVRDRLTYDEEQLGSLLGAVDGAACCCGSGELPRATILRAARELAGKVASVRVTARKPEEGRPSLFTAAVGELVAIGAAIGSNCEACFEHHYAEARKLGVSREEVRLAVEMAQAVKDAPARSISELVDRRLREPAGEVLPCCCGPSTAEAGSAGTKPAKRTCC